MLIIMHYDYYADWHRVWCMCYYHDQYLIIVTSYIYCILSSVWHQIISYLFIHIALYIFRYLSSSSVCSFDLHNRDKHTVLRTEGFSWSQVFDLRSCGWAQFGILQHPILKASVPYPQLLLNWMSTCYVQHTNSQSDLECTRTYLLIEIALAVA